MRALLSRALDPRLPVTPVTKAWLLALPGYLGPAKTERDRGLVSEEDRTLASVCSRVVSVAEVGRRRLAQRSVESVTSNRTPNHADGV